MKFLPKGNIDTVISQTQLTPFMRVRMCYICKLAKSGVMAAIESKV